MYYCFTQLVASSLHSCKHTATLCYGIMLRSALLYPPLLQTSIVIPFCYVAAVVLSIYVLVRYKHESQFRCLFFWVL